MKKLLFALPILFTLLVCIGCSDSSNDVDLPTINGSYNMEFFATVVTEASGNANVIGAISSDCSQATKLNILQSTEQIIDNASLNTDNILKINEIAKKKLCTSNGSMDAKIIGSQVVINYDGSDNEYTVETKLQLWNIMFTQFPDETYQYIKYNYTLSNDMEDLANNVEGRNLTTKISNKVSDFNIIENDNGILHISFILKDKKIIVNDKQYITNMQMYFVLRKISDIQEKIDENNLFKEKINNDIADRIFDKFEITAKDENMVPDKPDDVGNTETPPSTDPAFTPVDFNIPETVKGSYNIELFAIKYSPATEGGDFETSSKNNIYNNKEKAMSIGFPQNYGLLVEMIGKQATVNYNDDTKEITLKTKIQIWNDNITNTINDVYLYIRYAPTSSINENGINADNSARGFTGRNLTDKITNTDAKFSIIQLEDEIINVRLLLENQEITIADKTHTVNKEISFILRKISDIPEEIDENSLFKKEINNPIANNTFAKFKNNL